MELRTDTTPLWTDTAPFPRFRKLERDEEVDVVVVGAGIVGLTAAYLLTLDGKRVAVVERERCAQIDTGHTSAHLTMVTDRRLTELRDAFGPDHAQAVWDAGLAAIARIDDIVRAEQIDCDFAWVPGYLHAPLGATADGVEEGFRDEAVAAAQLGFDATFVRDVPFVGGPGVRYGRQARFHPRKYLAGVARAIADRGGMIFEHTNVQEFSETPRARDAVPDEARAVHQLRRRRGDSARTRARRAVLGHGRSVSLHPARTAARPRRHRVRRRRSQDRTG